jgi:hypothetical protein
MIKTKKITDNEILNYLVSSKPYSNCKTQIVPTCFVRIFYHTILSIVNEYHPKKSSQEKIKFCLDVEKNAMAHPDLAPDLIAYNLL